MNPDETTLTATRYLAALAELLKEQGISRDELLAQTGLSADQLSDSQSYVTRQQMEKLVSKAISLSGNPALGLDLGRKLNISAHGSLGIAGLTAVNFGQAVTVAIGYFPLISTLITPYMVTSGNTTAIELVPQPDLHPDTEAFLIQTLLGSTVLMADFQLGGHATAVSLQLAWPEKARLRQALDARGHRRLTFNADKHRVVFPSRLLTLAFPLADRQTHEQALARCREELKQLEAQRTLADRIYQQLISQDSILDMEQMSEKMGISSRSLRRRLESEGWRYRELCNKATMARAKQLMTRDRMPVTAVAYHLGYRDSANFSRAFRRETGQTPSNYQKKNIQ